MLKRLEKILILAVSLVVFTIVAFLFFTRAPKDKNNLNTGKQSSDCRSESSVVESSETTASTSKSSINNEMSDSQKRPDTSKRISGFVARQYTLDEKSGMTEEFLTWASERAIIGGMAVNSAYFTHGASGTGDWYAETPDGLVLVQQQHPEGRPGYDYYSIHEVGGVIFFRGNTLYT
ncbi:hypothetical protein ACWN8V_01650 [Vagococcus elongatus]|uniref:DUF4767 domain-containing protein n=1 Tax=Vagococcus elongatus TaxID=180344 RepID=A0A430B4J7_9ENTE|nr:hypothetical protein [Vagococcus elongatus]RSU15247.1 hypothetical protein CBF29_02630 [Vagococcus elongatus]